MASFVSFAPPPVYGLRPSQHHCAQFEEPVPTDDEDSGYGNNDYDFVRPSPIDPLGFNKSIRRHGLSALSLRQAPPQCAPLFRHITPFTSPDQDGIRSGPSLNNENSPHLHHHKHKSRVPTGLPPLSTRVQSDASSPTPSHPNSPDTHSQRNNPLITSLLSSATPVRTFAASTQISDQDLCNFHDRHLAAEWQKLYQASRKLERQRVALMARLDVGRVAYRRDFTDRRWAAGTRGMAVSDDGMEIEVGAERTKRHGRGRRSSRAN